MKTSIYTIISSSIFLFVYTLIGSSNCIDSYKPIETLAFQQADPSFVQGKLLFKKHCKGCHSMDMKLTLTAPPLGGITKRRTKTWLYAYTRDNFAMYRNGDSIAKTLKNDRWALMTSFPNLSDKELDLMYYFIEKRYQMTLDGIPVPIEFEFNISENKRAKACHHILKDSASILQISVSSNRFWTFSCGNSHHKASEYKRTTLKTMFELDNSVNNTAYLSRNLVAKRSSKTEEWELYFYD